MIKKTAGNDEKEKDWSTVLRHSCTKCKNMLIFYHGSHTYLYTRSWKVVNTIAVVAFQQMHKTLPESFLGRISVRAVGLLVGARIRQ
jgi:hypothetical protein